MKWDPLARKVSEKTASVGRWGDSASDFSVF